MDVRSFRKISGRGLLGFDGIVTEGTTVLHVNRRLCTVVPGVDISDLEKNRTPLSNYDLL